MATKKETPETTTETTEEVEAGALRKKDIIRNIAEKTEQPLKVVREVLDSYHGFLHDTLMNAQPVSIPDVGHFKITDRPERDGFNPLTKEKIKIPARKGIRFKLCKSIKVALKEAGA